MINLSEKLYKLINGISNRAHCDGNFTDRFCRDVAPQWLQGKHCTTSFRNPYQNIRSLVYISRKYAANLQHVCGLYLRRVCRKRVFRMQISFLAHCSGPQCAPQECSAQLSRTVLAHNVRRKFAVHSCRALFWHTMCAASLQRTVVAHYSCVPQLCGAQLSCTGLFCPHPTPLSPPTPHPTPVLSSPRSYFFLVPYPQGECEKKCGDCRSVTKNKNLRVGVGKNVGAGGW